MYSVLHDLHHAGNLGAILPKQFGALIKQEIKSPRSAALATETLDRYDEKSGGLRSWSKANKITQDQLDAFMEGSFLVRDGECIYAPEAQKYCHTHPPNRPIPTTSADGFERPTSPHGHFGHECLAPAFQGTYNPQQPLPPGRDRPQAQQRLMPAMMEFLEGPNHTEGHISAHVSAPAGSLFITNCTNPTTNASSEVTEFLQPANVSSHSLCGADDFSPLEAQPSVEAATLEETAVTDAKDAETPSPRTVAVDTPSAPGSARSSKRGRNHSDMYCVSPQKKMSRSSSPAFEE